MRILVVSAHYPPDYIGGYELGCRDVVERLRRRGHEVLVLTGEFRLETSEPEEVGVRRILRRQPPEVRMNKLAECAKLHRAARELNADLIYFWSQSELCYWLGPFARFFGYPVAYFLSDTAFTDWRVGAWLAGPAAKSWLLRSLFGNSFLVRGWPVVRGQNCHFASEFLRDQAIGAQLVGAGSTSVVAHWGIEPGLFAIDRSPRWPPRRMLYVGQITPQKGVHTAIAALGALAAEPGLGDLTLSVVGGGRRPDYETGLRALPAQLGIADRVRFLGKLPRTELPRVYAEHDILVFPSEWEEPFAITPLEAMAAGLVVVGTTTGGSAELLRDRDTAMTFVTGDAQDCARAVRELAQDRGLWEKISRRGKEEVLAHHTLDSMVDRIEASLERPAGSASSPLASPHSSSRNRAENAAALTTPPPPEQH